MEAFSGGEASGEGTPWALPQPADHVLNGPLARSIIAEAEKSRHIFN